jgi:hypothetical protein
MIEGILLTKELLVDPPSTPTSGRKSSGEKALPNFSFFAEEVLKLKPHLSY